MPRPRTTTLIGLVLALALIEVIAVYGVHVVRRETLIAGMLSLAGAFVAVTVLGLLLRHWGGMAWPFSYASTGAAVVRRHRTEASFASLGGQIDSYLHNASRNDELHPTLRELARDRLAHHHGIDLDDEPVARSVLGDHLADYLYAPPANSMARRNRQNLIRLITRIEEL